MAYRVIWSRRALANLERLDEVTRKRVVQRAEQLSSFPEGWRQVIPLHGPLRGKFRARVGRVRMIFAVDHESGALTILSVVPREHAYD